MAELKPCDCGGKGTHLKYEGTTLIIIILSSVLNVTIKQNFIKLKNKP